MTRPYGERAIAAAVALVSLGLIAAVFVVWTQAAQISANRDLTRQLLARSEEDRRDAEQLRSLVLRLQQQVRDLGGTPEELPASPNTRPEPQVTAPAERSRRATPAATGTPAPSRPTPTPSRSPSSPSPTPSPSPTRLCAGPVCVPPGS